MAFLVNLRTDIPVPNAPGADDVTRRGTELGNWLAHSGGSVFVIIICLIGAMIVMSLLKRPFVRGLVIGIAILAVALAAGVFK